MFKITLGQIYLAKDIWAELLKNTLKIKTFVNIERLLPKLEKELVFIENKRIELIKKYGKKMSENSDEWKVNEENYLIFNSEFVELLDIEVELSEVNKFESEEFSDIKLDLDKYLLLKPFINV